MDTSLWRLASKRCLQKRPGPRHGGEPFLELSVTPNHRQNPSKSGSKTELRRLSGKRGPKPRDLAQKARPRKWQPYRHILMAFGIQKVSPEEAWAEAWRGAVSRAPVRPNHGQNPSKSGSKTGLRRPSGKRGPKPRDSASKAGAPKMASLWTRPYGVWHPKGVSRGGLGRGMAGSRFWSPRDG